MVRRDLEQHYKNSLIEHLTLELAGTKTELAGAKTELGNAVNKIIELETIIHRINSALSMAIILAVLAWPDKLVAMVTICESNILDSKDH